MSNVIFKSVEFDGIRSSFHTFTDHFPGVGKMVRFGTTYHFVGINKMVEHGFGSQRKIKRQSCPSCLSFPRRRESRGVKALSSNQDGVEK